MIAFQFGMKPKALSYSYLQRSHFEAIQTQLQNSKILLRKQYLIHFKLISDLYNYKESMINKFGKLITYACTWQKNIKRGDYSQIQQKDIQYFRTLLPNHSVVTDSHFIEPHNICFTKIVKGDSKLVLLPQNTEQVSKILKYCNQRKLAVVPQGGNTGLVGGSVPVFDEIIVNLKNMNKIEKFDPVSSVVTVEAGVILQKLNEFLEKQGFETPLDLGAKGSCQVGGNAATNAGGKYVIKYGSFRSHILGLQAVTPNGEILDFRSEIMKDNTGYDLKQLFIGGEGTLGIITKLNIQCPKIDAIRRIIAFKTDKFQTILNSLPKIKTLLGKNLCAIQYMDGQAYKAITDHLHQPIFDSVKQNQFLLFVQASTDDLDTFFEQLNEFQDVIMSNNDNQYFKIWKIREDIAIAAQKCGRMLAYDISFDVKEWANMCDKLREETKAKVIGYGHIGDGNLHVNVILNQGQQFDDSYVFEEVTKRKGSISAQHGVGLHKPKYLCMQKSPQILSIYRKIKHLFDPNGIMNPYKVVPQ